MSIDKTKINRQDLRVLQKNMVYCSGLPSNLTQDQLKSESYFGLYGKIEKIVVNPFPNRNYCSVYLTYANQFEAATAVLACNQFQISRSTLWCLFGTMKYCRFFLKKIQCKNIPNCPYLHTFDYKNQIQIQNSPSQAFPEHQRLAKQVLLKHPQKIKQLQIQNKPAGQLPQPLFAIQCLQNLNQQNIRLNRNVQQIERNNNKKQINSIIQNNSQISNEKPQQQIQKIVQQKDKQNYNSNNNNNNNIENICQQHNKIQIQSDQAIKKLILKQIEKIKGSKIIGNLKQQEMKIKEIIIANLLQ